MGCLARLLTEARAAMTDFGGRLDAWLDRGHDDYWNDDEDEPDEPDYEQMARDRDERP
jgi:hypothetical protein